MTMSNKTFSISPRHQGYLALALWGAITIFLLRHDVYGLDEGASRALLFSWSIADQVASSVTTFGMPDLRTLLFLPAGYLWTGNVFAVKILTVLLLGVTVWLLYDWKSRASGSESALLPTGLLLISPLTLEQIDTLAPGIYLLGAFGVGAWLDVQARSNPRPFNGWFFAQLFLCAFAVSLHPAGLAYPLALLWSRLAAPGEKKYQVFFLGGIAFATAFILLVRMGWNEVALFQNPLPQLGAIFSGSAPDDELGTMAWLPGVIVIALAIGVLLARFRQMAADLAGRSLLLGTLLGALAGDNAWGFIALSMVLYFGLPMALRPGQDGAEGGFMKQRGWVLLLLFICATLFMRTDKAYFELGRGGTLSAHDQLIRTLAVAAEGERTAREADDGEKKHARLIVASQWPGRTMIACRCDTFPLPPVERDAHGQPDPQAQLARLHSVTYLLLDPKQTPNIDLARNLALLGSAVETASLQPGGVVLHVRQDSAPSPDAAPHPEGNKQP